MGITLKLKKWSFAIVNLKSYTVKKKKKPATTTIKFKIIKMTGKTPVKINYGKLFYINTVHCTRFLQIFFLSLFFSALLPDLTRNN